MTPAEQKPNHLDIPTDCPQWDERLGWTGDAQVFCRTAAAKPNAPARSCCNAFRIEKHFLPVFPKTNNHIFFSFGHAIHAVKTSQKSFGT